jgi:acetyltransferase-like isoleucine patch superfamily enzyme
MRKIGLQAILTFISLFSFAVALAVLTTALVIARIPWGDFRGVALILAGVTLLYVWAFVIYRVFLRLMPLQIGIIARGSRAEFIAHVNILFYLVLFNTLIRTHFLPVPLLRLIYLALGARMGSNTYSAGVILDPPLTQIGKNCIIGHDAVLFSHAIEGEQFSLSPIVIGDGVTIGATAVIMAGAKIDHGAIISAGAVVPKDCRIGLGEVWGGVPARFLKAPETR